MTEAPRASERVALGAAGVVALVAGLGLLGWLTPWPGLASLNRVSIPMAPSSAIALLLLAGAVAQETRRRSPGLAIAVPLLVLAFAGSTLAGFVGGPAQVLEARLVRAPEMFGSVLTGRMSPWTALGLSLASLSLLFVGLARRRPALGAAAGSLALALGLLGSVVTLGYLFGAPLLYGSPIVPMALPTAVALAGLGLGLLGLTPRDRAPVRPFIGASAEARLLRAFLPVAPAIVAVELLCAQVTGLNPALAAALTALLSALVVTAVVSYAARGVSRELEHAQAEAERSQRDTHRLAAIVHSSADAIYAKSLDGTIVAWNASAVRLFGYAPAEAVGRSAKMLVHPGDEDEWAEILAKITSGQRLESKEANRVRKDGTELLVSLSESPLYDASGLVVGVSVIARDVSQQRAAERALRQSEEEFRQLAEAMPQIVWIARPDGWDLYLNQHWMDYTGLTLEESLGLGWNKAFHPEDQPRAWQAWQTAAATIGTYSIECRLRRADGVYRWWLIRGAPMRDLAGSVLRWCGTCTDIDDLRLAAREISEAEERFAKVFHSGLLAVGIAEVSSGRLIDVNGRCAEFFGYSRDEMIGRTVQELGLWVEPADRRRMVKSLSATHATSSGESNFRRKSGEVRQALVSMEAITLARIAEPLSIVVLVDVTERKQLESQLLHAQKMEAVGRLAGGVAHDFNNALGVILGYTELLMRQVGEGQRSKLEQILKATQRASGLTRQLLAFSRREIVDPKVLDLNALLRDLEKMLRRLIGEDVLLAITTGARLGSVKADAGQLEQVIMNLSVNAKDAMPGGGSLRIETANVSLDTAQVTRHEPMVPGPYVMLAVSDSGCGIAKDLQSQIFEPFFTTKEEGKGTGLGLAMVYGIVKQAGGYVWVYSEVGRGTTFKIYLPRVDAVAGVEAGPAESSMPSKGWETILLVEDENTLRTLTRELLEGHGYRVIEAAGPQEALELSATHPEPIQLLVTDVIMPHMNGRVLAEALVAARPGLHVLYMSGYTDDVLAHSGVLTSGSLLLEKPFTALALLDRVHLSLGPSAPVPAGPA